MPLWHTFVPHIRLTLQYFFFLFFPIFLLSTPFKVATYNVENLFDAVNNGTEYKEYIPHTHNWNSRMVEIKLNHIAEVICDLDADILALQEIENESIFTQLQKRLLTVGCGYDYGAISHKRGAAIQVALLSRFPITKQREIVVHRSSKVRNILEVDVEVKHRSLKLFVNHWKSKAYHGYESKRIVYAKVLQRRIAQLSNATEYILLGDFNSDYNAYLTLEDKNNNTHGKTAFSDVLKTKIDEEHIVKAPKGWHYTLWYELPVEERWSHKFYGKKSSLDQIVIPKTMVNEKGIEYVNDSFKVFKASYLFTKRGYINRWQYKKGKHRAKGYSDHLPIYAYFDTKSYVKNSKTQRRERQTLSSIESLYKREKLTHSVLLKRVVVLFKRGNHALIKQTPQGRGIFLYGCASLLQEGGVYDLRVESIKNYYGLKEITTAYVLKKYSKISRQSYVENPTRTLQQNELLRNIAGVYRHKKFYFEGRVLPIYFKNRKFTPKNGSKLKIAYALVGYYKKLQLVVFSKKDFKILE
jgi:endonuclease/exonuclease/phosphatase family metal-dependent hydrolase